MQSVEHRSHSQQILTLALVSIGTFSLLSSSVKAAQLTTSDLGGDIFFRNTAHAVKFGQATSGSVQLADAVCQSDKSQVYRYAVTNHYQIWICSDENNPRIPKYWIGRAKDGSGSLKLPLSDHTQNVFTAVSNAENGRYTYTLDLNRYRLTVVSPNGKRSVEKAADEAE